MIWIIIGLAILGYILIRFLQGDQSRYVDGELTGGQVDPNQDTVVFINGIRINADAHDAARNAIKSEFDTKVLEPRNVVGMYNKTAIDQFGMVLGTMYDVIETIVVSNIIRRDRWIVDQFCQDTFQHNGAVLGMAKVLQHFDGEQLIIIAHSQGCTMTAGALHLVCSCENNYNPSKINIQNFIVITIGSPWAIYPPGPRYIHIRRSGDPITWLRGDIGGTEQIIPNRSSLNLFANHGLEAYLEDVDIPTILSAVGVQTV